MSPVTFTPALDPKSCRVRMVKWLLRKIISGLYRVEYEGLEHVPEQGPVVLAANHPTYLDPFTLGLPVRRVVRFLAWDAPFRIPGVGHFMRAFGVIPVDLSRASRRSVMAALEVLRRGEVFGIFPEGQRSLGGRLLPFRPGAVQLAIKSGAPVVPVSIRGGLGVWRREWKLPRMTGRLHVRYHAPIDPPDRGRDKRAAGRALEAAVRATICAHIDYPPLEGHWPTRPSSAGWLKEEGFRPGDSYQ